MEFGNLSSLKYLYLNDNILYGSIPNELGSLINLKILCLHQNSLTGAIPVDLGNLSALTRLELYQNRLSGNIPTELGNLSNLQVLRLDHNQFGGNVPTTLENLILLYDPGAVSDGGDGLTLDCNSLIIPEGYPVPGNSFHTFLYQKDPNWHLCQGELNYIYLPEIQR